jgi:hypothetical protein
MSISASEQGPETEEERERGDRGGREVKSSREMKLHGRENGVEAQNNMCSATQALLRKYAPILIIVGAFLFLFWLRKKIYG